MHARREPTGHQQAVSRLFAVIDDHLFNPAMPTYTGDPFALSGVGNGNGCPRFPQGIHSEQRPVIVGGKHDIAADQHAMLLEVIECRFRQHHARTVIVGKNQRTLDRTRRNHDLGGTQLPQCVRLSLTPLPDGNKVVVINAEGRGARKHQMSAGFEIRSHLCRPIGTLHPVNFSVTPAKRTARLVAVIDKHHAPPAGRRSARCRKTRRPRAHHQHVASPVEHRTIGIRLIRGINPSEARHLSDARLEQVPVRQDEGLVVETRRQETGKPVQQGRTVTHRIRARIDRRDCHSVRQHFRGRAQVGHAFSIQCHIDNGIRLLAPASENSAWPVIFETSANDLHIFRQQRRGDTVTSDTFKAQAIEAETKPLGVACTVQTAGAHFASCRNEWLAITSCETVSRSMAKNSPQVTCTQISRVNPFGFFFM